MGSYGGRFSSFPRYGVMGMGCLIGICPGIDVRKTTTTARERCRTNRWSAMKASVGLFLIVALAMRIFPALSLPRTLFLPNTANSEGGHGGSNNVSRRHASNSSHTIGIQESTGSAVRPLGGTSQKSSFTPSAGPQGRRLFPQRF